MKILRTDEEFKDSIMKILKAKPSFFYASTFNLYVGEEVKEVLKLCEKVKDVKFIVGLQAPSLKQLDFFRRTSYFSKVPIKLVRDHHLKLIVSNSKAIIGGRNLTGSGWTDLSFEIKNSSNITQLKSEFNKIYKNCKLF